MLVCVHLVWILSSRALLTSKYQPKKKRRVYEGAGRRGAGSKVREREEGGGEREIERERARTRVRKRTEMRTERASQECWFLVRVTVR